MASIQRRRERWRVQVRRHGLPPLSKTFDRHEEARRWAHKLEGRIAADDFVDLSEARQTSLGEALERYLIEATPAKKGSKQERNRIKAWLRDPLADRPLASVRSLDIAAWRNERVAGTHGCCVAALAARRAPQPTPSREAAAAIGAPTRIAQCGGARGARSSCRN